MELPGQPILQINSRDELIQAANDIYAEYVYLFTEKDKWEWFEVFNDERHWQKL